MSPGTPPDGAFRLEPRPVGHPLPETAAVDRRPRADAPSSGGAGACGR